MSDTPDPADDAARERELRAMLGLPTQTADELAALHRSMTSALLGPLVRPEFFELLRLARRSEALAELRASPGGVPYVHLSPRE